MKKTVVKYIYISVILILALLFVAKFAGVAILKAYVTTGIGDCRTMPVLCVIPDKEVINMEIDRAHVDELLLYQLPGINISIPRGFTVIKGKVTKVYYKRKRFDADSPVIYLLYQKPKFFVNLYPYLARQGITDNYRFVSRTMYARPENINGITDAFFVIMKAVFTPDIGDQEDIGMVKFNYPDKRGFITYNLTPLENYFDCDVIAADDSFCKVYIKDRKAALGLRDVLTIISTMEISDIPVAETAN
ncbi:MAG: hypothetical protein ABH806_03400 [Candidatus Omnitrophota bacterium]